MSVAELLSTPGYGGDVAGDRDAPAPGTLLLRRATGRGGRGRRHLMRRLLMAADVVAVALGSAVAVAMTGSADGARSAMLAAAVPVWVLLAGARGLYDRDVDHGEHSTVDEIGDLVAVATATVWLVLLIGHAAATAPDVATLALLWLLVTAVDPLLRGLARAVGRRRRSYLQNTVIVGAGAVAQVIARKILQHPEYGLRIVGFFADDPPALRAEVADVPVLGPARALPDAIRGVDVDRVVIAVPAASDGEAAALVRGLRGTGVQIDVAPPLSEVVGPRAVLHALEAFPLIALRPARPTPVTLAAKRAVDLVIALVALVLLAPVLALIALCVRRDSTGPVLFRQERLGLGGRPFTMLKFRTMLPDSDDGAHRAYIRATMAASAPVGRNGTYKLDQDARVTRVGRWLRRTSFDELPQLVNVVRGDMSLVGPRPCIPYETEDFRPHHFERFRVKPGITGYWQVAARARAPFGEALDMDVAYARGWSFGLDLRLLLRTPAQLLRQKGTT